MCCTLRCVMDRALHIIRHACQGYKVTAPEMLSPFDTHRIIVLIHKTPLRARKSFFHKHKDLFCRLSRACCHIRLHAGPSPRLPSI